MNFELSNFWVVVDLEKVLDALHQFGGQKLPRPLQSQFCNASLHHLILG
jgi:hypothetical protein